MIPAAARDWLGSAPIRPLWTAVHRRLERNGRTPRGRLTLRALSHEERDAVGELLGHAVAAEPTIDLAALDVLLTRSAAAAGLVEVAEALLGPVADRRAAAAAEADRRQALRAHGLAAIAAAGLSDRPWAEPWLDRVWRAGAPLLDQATTVLGLMLGPYARPWSRKELAERATGSAHGLDDDAPLTRLVLRGLAMAVGGGTEAPPGAAARRALWEAAGVVSDTVATTVLTYGLAPLGDGWRAAALRTRAAHHAETHLTLREVRELGPLRLTPQTVYVCENPRVLEAAADARLPATLICAMGNPTVVTLALLDELTADPDVRLAYHGDFDWPGIAIADRVIRRYHARPWHFGASDYLAAVRAATARGTPLQPLAGQPLPTSWDADLSAAMAAENLAVHEEALIDILLDGLR
jgi:uncharacterized protein (TIGR02679 family)